MITLFNTDNSRTTIIIRMMVGIVFLSEGIQKFLYPETRGAGRFEKIGLPSPEFFGSFIGFLEILCGCLILIGLSTRFASIILMLIMLSAIILTKIPIVITEGIWSMLHDSRTDFSMLLGSFFLLIKGGGKWSVDKTIYSHA